MRPNQNNMENYGDLQPIYETYMRGPVRKPFFWPLALGLIFTYDEIKHTGVWSKDLPTGCVSV